MKYLYTDWPMAVSHDVYMTSIRKMASLMMDTGMVRGVYQVGSVGAPGISDVDLIVIFNENTRTDINPVKGLEFPDNYLFVHRLFGTTAGYALQLEKFVFFSNYIHLAGEKFNFSEQNLNEQESRTVKRQVALEYLIKAWLSISISVEMKLVKVRGLLLHAKGILHDIRFLEMENTRLEKCIHQFVKARDHWFVNPLTSGELDVLVDEYRAALYEIILNGIEKYGFFIPREASLKISRRIRIKKGTTLSLLRKGFRFPVPPGSAGSKVRKLNNVLNSFELTIPYSDKDIPAVLQERYKLMETAFRYNSANLPGFICTGHGLDLYTKEER